MENGVFVADEMKRGQDIGKACNKLKIMLPCVASDPSNIIFTLRSALGSVRYATYQIDFE